MATRLAAQAPTCTVFAHQGGQELQFQHVVWGRRKTVKPASVSSPMLHAQPEASFNPGLSVLDSSLETLTPASVYAQHLSAQQQKPKTPAIASANQDAPRLSDGTLAAQVAFVPTRAHPTPLGMILLAHAIQDAVGPSDGTLALQAASAKIHALQASI